jgi:DNA-binding Xre family transcriptional regulator
MAEKDLQQLRQVFREALRATRLRDRDLERRLGIGHGNLQRLLDGRLDLRVRHLLALAELLSVPPGDLLEHGCPEAAGQAKRRLGDWIGQRSGKPAETTAASLSLDQLKDLIRSAVRAEIELQATEAERIRGAVREELQNAVAETSRRPRR